MTQKICNTKLQIVKNILWKEENQLYFFKKEKEKKLLRISICTYLYHEK